MVSQYRSRAACALAATLISIVMLLPAARSSAGEGAQDVVVPSAGPIPTSGLARFFTINEVLAGRSANPTVGLEQGGITATGEPTGGTAASLSSRDEEPFGLYAFRAPDGQISAKWLKVEADIAHDLVVMDKCRHQGEQCASPAAARFNAIVDEARKHDGLERLASVNRAVNGAIRYMTDFQQYGVADVWSSPLATFGTGKGDCEDYAIAKYVALREAGLSEQELRLLLVHDSRAREDHAVLVARQGGKWLVLDNRFTQLPSDHDMWNFEPVYAINQDGVRLLARPFDKDVVVADNLKSAKAVVSSVKRPENIGKRADGDQPLLEAGNLVDAGVLAA